MSKSRPAVPTTPPPVRPTPFTYTTGATQHEEQAEDVVLNYIYDRTIAHPKDIEDMGIEYRNAMENLMTQDMLRTAIGRRKSLTLTKKGLDAHKIGYHVYIRKQDKNARYQKIGSMVLAATAILSFLFQEPITKWLSKIWLSIIGG